MDSFGKKQPYEEYFVAFDFTNIITAGDTIATATVTACDIEAPTVDLTSTITTVAEQVITSPKVYVWIKGGTTGHTYKLTCKIVTNEGEKYELDARLPVLEI